MCARACTHSLPAKSPYLWMMTLTTSSTSCSATEWECWGVTPGFFFFFFPCGGARHVGTIQPRVREKKMSESTESCIRLSIKCTNEERWDRTHLC